MSKMDEDMKCLAEIINELTCKYGNIYICAWHIPSENTTMVTYTNEYKSVTLRGGK